MPARTDVAPLKIRWSAGGVYLVDFGSIRMALTRTAAQALIDGLQRALNGLPMVKEKRDDNG